MVKRHVGRLRFHTLGYESTVTKFNIPFFPVYVETFILFLTSAISPRLPCGQNSFAAELLTSYGCISDMPTSLDEDSILYIDYRSHALRTAYRFPSSPVPN